MPTPSASLGDFPVVLPARRTRRTTRRKRPAREARVKKSYYIFLSPHFAGKFLCSPGTVKKAFPRLNKKLHSAAAESGRGKTTLPATRNDNHAAAARSQSEEMQIFHRSCRRNYLFRKHGLLCTDARSNLSSCVLFVICARDARTRVVSGSAEKTRARRRASVIFSGSHAYFLPPPAAATTRSQ